VFSLDGQVQSSMSQKLWPRLDWSKILPQGRQKRAGGREAGLRIIDLAERGAPGFRTAVEDRPRSLAHKSVADRIAAMVALLLLSPLLLAVAAAIRLSSTGPIVYRQVRIGMNRRTSFRPAGRASPYYDVYDRRTLELPGRAGSSSTSSGRWSIGRRTAWGRSGPRSTTRA